MSIQECPDYFVLIASQSTIDPFMVPDTILLGGPQKKLW